MRDSARHVKGSFFILQDPHGEAECFFLLNYQPILGREGEAGVPTAVGRGLMLVEGAIPVKLKQA